MKLVVFALTVLASLALGAPQSKQQPVRLSVSAQCPGVVCPGGCCPYEGWVCCPDAISCAVSLSECPQKDSSFENLVQRVFTNIQKLNPGKEKACPGGTECPGGCCSHEFWFCCPDGVFCAIDQQYCPAKKAIPSILGLLRQ